MSKRTWMLLLVGCLFAGALSAAEDPFVGDWKLNASRSKLVEVMKVQSVAGNKYAFDVGAGTETIAADGTDQPGYGGTALSVTIEGPDSWKVVRKKDGRMLLTAYWKLSKDGNTLNDDYTEFAPNGSSSNQKLVFGRTAGKAGFEGTWEMIINAPANFVIVLKVQPYQGDGLSFINPSAEVTKSVKFDGKDYPNEGPKVAQGSTSSGRRVDERALEVTDKMNGKTMATKQFKLSADGKTLTMVMHPVGQRTPSIFVFDRE